MGSERVIRRLLGWLIAAGILLAGCANLFESYCAPSPEAFLVLEDLGAGGGPSRLKARTVTPRREALTYSAEGKSYRADLYRLPTDPLAAIVLVPGAAQQGKDDPRLVAFANTLARARFAVLVPDLEGVRDLKMRPSDIGEVRDAFVYLASRADLTPHGRVGIGAHSYAVGPAVLAAMDPEIRDKVRFIQGVGGYFDLERVLTFFTTGDFQEEGGRWRHLEPNAYGKWTFVASNADLVSSPEDQRLLREIAGRKLVDAQADTGALAAQLSPEGRTLYDLATNQDRARVKALLDRLPAPIRADIQALTLAGKDLSRLKARMILIHGRDDDIIPYVESVSLDRALSPWQSRLFLVDALSHVNLKGFGPMDTWRMACAVDTLLAERRR